MINYLFEVKVRVLYVIFFFVVMFLFSFIYREALLYLLTKKCLLKNGNFMSYFIYTDPTEVFHTYVQICSFTSVYFSFPYLLWHIWMFINPGLYKHEHVKIRFYFLAYALIFLVTTFLIYQVFFPWSWHFFSSFEKDPSGSSVGMYFEAKLNEYVQFIFYLYFVIGFCCQLCLMLLGGVVHSFHDNLKLIKKIRRYVYAGTFIFAAVITPPDVISQLIVGVPLICLYELVLFLLFVKKEYEAHKNEIETSVN